MTKVSSIHIYPIKSTAGISLPSAQVEALGLTFDRRFVVCDLSGQFITARTEPRLCLVNTKLTNKSLTLSTPGMETLVLLYDEFTNQYQKLTVWGDEVNGQLCSKKANLWFSEYLQRPCELLFFGQDSHRERKPKTDNARKLAFADGYPLLLTSQASLNALNNRFVDTQQINTNNSENAEEVIVMAQFRPNIVVSDCLPFAEDSWQHIRIGEVEFKVSKPCERCIFITVNPLTGEKNQQQQPLKMLKSFRQAHNGEVLFGQNLIALNSGTVRQDDKVIVISNQKPPTFITPNLTSEVQKLSIEESEHVVITQSAKKKLTITFEKWNKKHKISTLERSNDNVEKTLLEYGEDAGLILPYSCRAGMCSRCKAKLISGEVKENITDGLTTQEQQEGYVLCCSTIPLSDVTIKHE
jgi:uncharacterized protein YcbX/ferredoxin